jgi:hypothetical protein
VTAAAHNATTIKLRIPVSPAAARLNISFTLHGGGRDERQEWKLSAKLSIG